MLEADVYRVQPFVLRRILDKDTEHVATADVDGKPALLVPVTEEAAKEANAVYADFEALPVTTTEIEGVCVGHGLCLVGFLGFDGPDSLTVASVEVVGMILEEE